MQTMNPDLRDEIHQLHAQICGGLADPNRILILYALAETSLCVGDLVTSIGLSQPSISHHLRVLRERGLVTSRREGQNVVYTLSDPRVIEALDLLRSVLADVLHNRSALGINAAS